MYAPGARLGQWDESSLPPLTAATAIAPSPGSPWAQAITTIAKGVTAIAPAVATVVTAVRRPSAPAYIVAAPPTYAAPAYAAAAPIYAGAGAAAMPTWGWVALGLVGVGAAVVLVRR